MIYYNNVIQLNKLINKYEKIVKVNKFVSSNKLNEDCLKIKDQYAS